jgi:hypothetical protein
MSTIESLNTIYLALGILISATVFLVAWYFDSKMHGEIAGRDITDRELQTHRLILIPSVLMEVTLVFMYFINPWYLLPPFLAFYLTRTVQEGIDELHFHVDRCTPYESYLHLIMWCSVHTKTFFMFIWGFFFQFQGVESLPVFLYPLFLIIFSFMGLIGLIEWRR